MCHKLYIGNDYEMSYIITNITHHSSYVTLKDFPHGNIESSIAQCLDLNSNTNVKEPTYLWARGQSLKIGSHFRPLLASLYVCSNIAPF